MNLGYSRKGNQTQISAEPLNLFYILEKTYTQGFQPAQINRAWELQFIKVTVKLVCDSAKRNRGGSYSHWQLISCPVKLPERINHHKEEFICQLCPTSVVNRMGTAPLMGHFRGSIIFTPHFQSAEFTPSSLDSKSMTSEYSEALRRDKLDT